MAENGAQDDDARRSKLSHFRAAPRTAGPQLEYHHQFVVARGLTTQPGTQVPPGPRARAKRWGYKTYSSAAARADCPLLKRITLAQTCRSSGGGRWNHAIPLDLLNRRTAVGDDLPNISKSNLGTRTEIVAVSRGRNTSNTAFRPVRRYQASNEHHINRRLARRLDWNMQPETLRAAVTRPSLRKRSSGTSARPSRIGHRSGRSSSAASVAALSNSP